MKPIEQVTKRSVTVATNPPDDILTLFLRFHHHAMWTDSIADVCDAPSRLSGVAGWIYLRDFWIVRRNDSDWKLELDGAISFSRDLLTLEIRLFRFVIAELGEDYLRKLLGAGR
jgi:hypothetical protein